MFQAPRPLVAVSIAVAGTLLGDSLLYAVLPTVWAELGLELWMVGVLLSANRFVRLLTNPLAGRVIERFGVRVPFVTAVLLSAATTCAYGLTLGFVVFLLARVAWGSCWSFLRLGGYLTALHHSDDRTRGQAFGFYTGVIRLGTLAGVLFGGILTDELGFRTTVFVFGGATLLSALILLRDRSEPGSSAEEPLTSSTVPDPRPEPRSDASDPHPVRRWAVYVAALVNGAAGSSLVVSTLGLWLLEHYGERIELASLEVGVASLTGAILGVRFLIDVLWAPRAGKLSDRLGRIPFMALTGAGVIAALVGLSTNPGLFLSIGLAIALFASGTAVRVSLDAATGDLTPPELRPRVMSWYGNWSDLGAALGPFIAYQLVAGVGLASIYRGAALILVVVWVLALAALRKRGERG